MILSTVFVRDALRSLTTEERLIGLEVLDILSDCYQKSGEYDSASDLKQAIFQVVVGNITHIARSDFDVIMTYLLFFRKVDSMIFLEYNCITPDMHTTEARQLAMTNPQCKTGLLFNTEFSALQSEKPEDPEVFKQELIRLVDALLTGSIREELIMLKEEQLR
jgi:hypothetical protein